MRHAAFVIARSLAVGIPPKSFVFERSMTDVGDDESGTFGDGAPGTADARREGLEDRFYPTPPSGREVATCSGTVGEGPIFPGVQPLETSRAMSSCAGTDGDNAVAASVYSTTLPERSPVES